jgi:hypothetical protein
MVSPSFGFHAVPWALKAQCDSPIIWSEEQARPIASAEMSVMPTSITLPGPRSVVVRPMFGALSRAPSPVCSTRYTADMIPVTPRNTQISRES